MSVVGGVLVEKGRQYKLKRVKVNASWPFPHSGNLHLTTTGVLTIKQGHPLTVRDYAYGAHNHRLLVVNN